MKKLLKNKKFLAMTLGTVLVGASVVATAAACAAKLTTSETPTVSGKKLTFKLSGETLPSALNKLNVVITKEDGTSEVVYTNATEPVNGGTVEVELKKEPVKGDKVIITSAEFKTNFVIEK